MIKNNGYLNSELQYYADMLHKEYNITIEKGIELLKYVFEEKQLVKDVLSNYSYAVITVENDFFNNGIKAYDWKYEVK